MNEPTFHSSILERDQKAFLVLTGEEADVWIPRVFDRVAPSMPLIYAILQEDGDNDGPVNLEAVLAFAHRAVREVAVEMAGALLTQQRMQQVIPQLNAYCDELLAQGRTLDATFVQQGLIGIVGGLPPAQNTLLVEVCMHCIHQTVNMINGSPRSFLRSH